MKNLGRRDIFPRPFVSQMHSVPEGFAFDSVYMAAPKEPMTFYIFAAVLGATWLATVPPTAGITAKLFGTRYLATLFGLTLLSHQIGGFLGAWLGGIAVVATGNYEWMWWADAVLAVLAALVNLPIEESKPAPRVAVAAT